MNNETLTNGGGKSKKNIKPVMHNTSGIMKKSAYKGLVRADEINILENMMKNFGINDAPKKARSKTVKNEKMLEDNVRPSERLLLKPSSIQNEPMLAISSTKSKRQRKEIGIDTESKRQKKEVVKNESMLAISSTKSKRQRKEVGIDNTASKKQRKTVVVKNTDYYEDIMLSDNPRISIEERIAAGEALKEMREEEFSRMVQAAEKEMKRISGNEALKAIREEEFNDMVQAAELEMVRIDIELNGLKNKQMIGGKKKRIAKK